MIHPLWIFNSSLVVFIFVNMFFAYFTRVVLSQREDIDPNLYSKPQSEQHVNINLKYIYENDLFDSYQKEGIYSRKPTIQTKPLPQPPRQQPIKPPEGQKPVFLDPLNVTLRGIIIKSQNENLNTAIISDNKTDTESLYKIGDKIQDSQLIRIFNNKIILLRSNGQQEVLYMRDQEAQSDPRFAQIQNWHTAILMINPSEYTIYPEAFLKRIENLSHFIELLNLTTAYEKGIPTGTHVGTVEPQTVGSYLGLRTGDIITEINSSPVATTSDRLTVYKEITQKNPPFTITVRLMRNKNLVTIDYHIEPFKTELIKSELNLQTNKIEPKKLPIPSIQEDSGDTLHNSSQTDISSEEFESFDDLLNGEIAFIEKLRNRDTLLALQNNTTETEQKKSLDQNQDFV